MKLNIGIHGGSSMSRTNMHRESRFFTGDERELQEIKSKESLQKFIRHKKNRKRLSKFGQLVIFGALAVIFLIVCLAVFFRIDTVEVVGTSRYTKDDILALTDIREGLSLYEVSDKNLEGLVGRLAYIKEANVVRRLPNTLVISLMEVEPRYVCRLYGEYFVLSSELFVLERCFTDEGFSELGLVELLLPSVDCAVVGKELEFSEEISDKYVRAYLDALDSGRMYEYATAFDLRDRFSLGMIAKDTYLVDLGNGDELATKLTVVAGMLESQVFADGVSATIDANDPTQCAVIKNPGLEIKFEDKKLA